MDSGQDEFLRLEHERLSDLLSGASQVTGGIFSVGEEIEIKGSRFRIRKITRKDLILRILPNFLGGRK